MVRCPGHQRPPHIFDGKLVATREGSFCTGCAGARHRLWLRGQARAEVRARTVLYLDPDSTAPVPAKAGHLLIANAIARAADPEKVLRILGANRGAPLELAVSDDGCALWCGSELIHRLPKKESTDVAA